eukprot:1790724-Alexandrium_andersonii.AAC.1
MFTRKNRHEKRRAAAKYSKMSLTGGHRLAVLRNHGHISASALLTTVDLDATRHVVVNWEKKMAATLSY